MGICICLSVSLLWPFVGCLHLMPWRPYMEISVSLSPCTFYAHMEISVSVSPVYAHLWACIIFADIRSSLICLHLSPWWHIGLDNMLYLFVQFLCIIEFFGELFFACLGRSMIVWPMRRRGIWCKHISYFHIWAQMGHAQIWAYTDDISNLHIWTQKGKGLTDTEIQLSRSTDPATIPIWSCTFG